jgi:hypothetical protein
MQAYKCIEVRHQCSGLSCNQSASYSIVQQRLGVFQVTGGATEGSGGGPGGENGGWGGECRAEAAANKGQNPCSTARTTEEIGRDSPKENHQLGEARPLLSESRDGPGDGKPWEG